jgi:glyoxylase-like metal-dependent hydrolase (beta-lactamase superfamily II)
LQFIEGYEQVALSEQLSPFTRGYELPGSDGQIVLVPLPGHAAGHIGAFILTDDGWTLLASDSAWSPVSYQELRGPSVLANVLMDDSKAYYRTLNLLNQLWAAGHVDIRLCHEGDL